jgi:CDP-glucose 4,6-dehydratase
MVTNWGNGASWELDKNNNPHEAGYLKLDCSKAAMRLNWYPKWNLEHTLESIINWHQHYIAQKNIQEQCLLEIAKYQKD